MTEQILKNYFNGDTPPDALDCDLVKPIADSNNTLFDSTSNIERGKSFVVTSKHLVMLCRDIVNNRIRLEDLKEIAHLLKTSALFTWNENDTDGRKVEDAISNLTSSETISMQYVQYCGYYLQTGEHR